MKKIRLALLFGGRSAEHEISIQSAKSVIENLCKEKYDIIPIHISKQGNFYYVNQDNKIPLISNNNIEFISGKLNKNILKSIDIVFPMLHGTCGEDGSIQGLLKSLNLPFVGPDVLGSAVGMDKDVTKRLLREADILCVKSIVFHEFEINKIKYDPVALKLGNTLYVKPANLGSSIGISKVQSNEEFNKAIKKAFLYDNKIIIEEFMHGREIECAVLGNEYPVASSVLGEIVTKESFYNYEAKYNNPKATELIIPARLPKNIIKKIKNLAIKVFKVLCCEGMARVDFFIKDNYELIVNEINTIPGFTKKSMYYRLWEASGVPYSNLLDQLIELAIARHERDSVRIIDIKF
jgi:D-alanine-D-alanine ligase